jgi:hypothetical protein
LWVVGRLVLPAVDGDVVDGFNLDGLDTAADDPTGCGIPDQVSPSGERGIDNLFGANVPFIDLLIPVLGPPSAQFLFDDAIADGDMLLGVVFENAGQPGRVNASIYNIEATTGVAPAIENDVVVAGQTYVLVGDPLYTALDLDTTSGTIELGPFTAGISILSAVDVPFVDARMRFDVGALAGTGLVGGTADPAPIIEEEPLAAQLITRDMPLPGGTGCDGMSWALYVQAVRGILQ